MYDLRQDFCADVYRLRAELEAGMQWPQREEFYTSTSGLPRNGKDMQLILRTTLAMMCQSWGFPEPPQKSSVRATRHTDDQRCTTCDCGQSGGGPQAVSAYTRGFLQGFSSCLGGVFQGPISALMDDGRDFAAIGQALVNGDGTSAARLLSIKGERNRTQFDQFIRSLNPNIYNVSPQEAGLRDGYRLCGFGFLPAVFKAGGVKMISGRTLMLTKSGTALRLMRLEGASALVNRNNPATGVGLVFEEAVGGNLAQGFTTIDGVPANELMNAVFDRGGLLENPSQIFSAKTLGATPGSYLSPGSVLSTVKKYLNSLNNYTSACKNGIRVVAGPDTRRVFKLGIPASATTQQLAQVDEAAMLARSMGIEFQVYRLEGVDGW